nr:drug resistance protein [Quercus suber]
MTTPNRLTGLIFEGTFWGMAIALAGIAIAVQVVIPDPQILPQAPRTVKALVDDLDLIAATVGITALVLFNFAWNQAPIVGWQSPYVIVCLILGLLMVPGFFYLELRVSPDPLIPFSVLNSTNAFVLGCIACGWANFGVWIYYLWQILEVLRGASPLLVSAYLSPLVVAGAIAALMTGVLLGHIRAAWVMVIAMAAFLAGNLLIATLPPHQIYWAQIFVCACVAPIGMDMSFPAGTIYLSNSIEKERQVEVHVNNGGETPEDTLTGYRGALYMGTGLAGFGLALSIVFVLKTYWDDYKVQHRAIDSENVSGRDQESDQ